MANLMVYDQPMTEAQAESMHRALVWTDILPGEAEYNATSTVTITYQYDPLYRLTSASYSAGAEYVYSYDAVGNRQTMTSPGGQVSYTYDHANRLMKVAEGPLTTQFAYDGDGARSRKRVGGETTQYVLGPEAMLPVVISDTDAVCLCGLRRA